MKIREGLLCMGFEGDGCVLYFAEGGVRRLSKRDECFDGIWVYMRGVVRDDGCWCCIGDSNVPVLLCTRFSTILSARSASNYIILNYEI